MLFQRSGNRLDRFYWIDKVLEDIHRGDEVKAGLRQCGFLQIDVDCREVPSLEAPTPKDQGG
jgi:hypothetical protein